MADGFNSNRKAVESQFERNIVKTLTAMGLKQNELASKEITTMGAVDTGRMRASSSFQVNAQNKEVLVGNSADYAIYITMGTRHIDARPFMQNSINNYQNDYNEIVDAAMGEGFN
jgi:HK97 gp10 family phage protein